MPGAGGWVEVDTQLCDPSISKALKFPRAAKKEVSMKKGLREDREKCDSEDNLESRTLSVPLGPVFFLKERWLQKGNHMYDSDSAQFPHTLPAFT